MIVKHFYGKFLLLLTITLTLCKLYINYGPVWSFSIRLGLFSLKNWDRTVLQSSPKIFGDCTTVRFNFFRPDYSVVWSQFFLETVAQSSPKIQDQTVYKSVRSIRSMVSRSSPASLSISLVISIITDEPISILTVFVSQYLEY